MKEFSAFEKRAIINVAKSVYPLNNKLKTLKEKAQAIEAEALLTMKQIDMIEETIAPFTDGKKSSDFVKVEKQPTGANKYIFTVPEEPENPAANDGVEVEGPMAEDENNILNY